MPETEPENHTQGEPDTRPEDPTIDYNWRPTRDGGGGGYIIPNHPRTSQKNGCAKARVGKFAFTIAHKALICAPVSYAAGQIGTPVVGRLVWWGCGRVGDAAKTVIPWNNVCR